MVSTGEFEAGIEGGGWWLHKVYSYKYKIQSIYILLSTLENLQQGSLVSWPKIVQHRVQLEGSGCWSFCSHISHSPKFHFSMQITGPGIVRRYTLILRTFKLSEISDVSELESNATMQKVVYVYYNNKYIHTLQGIELKHIETSWWFQTGKKQLPSQMGNLSQLAQ